MKTRIKEKNNKFYPQHKWFFIWRNYLTLSSCYLELGDPIFFSNKNDAEEYLKYPELNI